MIKIILSIEDARKFAEDKLTSLLESTVTVELDLTKEPKILYQNFVEEAIKLAYFAPINLGHRTIPGKNIISAYKMARGLLGLTLKEAKKYVDSLIAILTGE